LPVFWGHCSILNIFGGRSGHFSLSLKKKDAEGEDIVK
jgi:hypothetical protein